MNKKSKLFLWILPLALMSMVFFYTSKVSTILPSVDYFEGNQGVIFNGKITNAPKSRQNYDSYSETEIPIVNNSYTKSSNYNTVSSSQVQNTFSHPYRMENSVTTSELHTPIAQTGNFTNNNINLNLNSGIGLSGMSFENKKNSSIAQASKTPGFSSLSEDMNPIFETSNRQSAGGVDPGADPTDPALALGDGFWILFILAAGYLVWKIKFTTRLIEQ